MERAWAQVLSAGFGPERDVASVQRLFSAQPSWGVWTVDYARPSHFVVGRFPYLAGWARNTVWLHQATLSRDT